MNRNIPNTLDIIETKTGWLENYNYYIINKIKKNTINLL